MAHATVIKELFPAYWPSQDLFQLLVEIVVAAVVGFLSKFIKKISIIRSIGTQIDSGDL